MKRTFVNRLISMILCLSTILAFIPITVSAFDDFQVEVIKSSAPVREGYYQSKDVIRRVYEGDILIVVGQKYNNYNNLWYKIEGGGYIYSGNVKKVHHHNYTLTSYGKQHPHYAEYQCTGCELAFCSTETKKVSDCKQCYPNQTLNITTTTVSHIHSYKLLKHHESHPHYAEYKCIGCYSSYISTETIKINGCDECYPHTHNYEFAFYGYSHPHYAEYQCTTCGSGYCSTETIKVDGCDKCYPHVHDYQFEYHDTAHPHESVYSCSCGSGYCVLEHVVVPTCSLCIWIEQGNELDVENDVNHVHNYMFIGAKEEHPHYKVYQCLCGSTHISVETLMTNKCVKCYNNTSQNLGVHQHFYEFQNPESIHPHYAKYLCECGMGYYAEEEFRLITCEVCFPEYSERFENVVTEDLKNHVCEFEFFGKMQTTHPHYAIVSCLICSAVKTDYNFTVAVEDCLQCNFGVYNCQDLYPQRELLIYSADINAAIPAPIETKNVIFSNMERLHLALDVCGVMPIVGGVCDATNALIYLIERRYVDMALSGISFVPIIGTVSGAGKVSMNSGYLVVETTGKLLSKGSKVKVIGTITKYDSLTTYAKNIISNSSSYADDVLESVVKIANDQDIPLEKLYLNNKIMITDNYKGTVISSAGLKYKVGSAQKHRIYHLILRHSSSQEADYLKKLAEGKIVEPMTFFKMSDEDIFKLIDDAYLNHTPIYTRNQGSRIVKKYDMGRVIGTNNETILYVVYDGQNIITAYPTT